MLSLTIRAYVHCAGEPLTVNLFYNLRNVKLCLRGTIVSHIHIFIHAYITSGRFQWKSSCEINLKILSFAFVSQK